MFLEIITVAFAPSCFIYDCHKECFATKIVVQESIVTGHIRSIIAKIIYFFEHQKGGTNFAFS